VYPSVSQAVVKVLAGEGLAPWMYLDTRNLVTTGRGNMIDPAGNGPLITYDQLAWQHAADGSPASPAEIQSAYLAVKQRPDLIPGGGRSAPWSQVSDLRLSDAAIEQLVNTSAAATWRTLVNILPNLESYPADAQLAVLRYAYASGPDLIRKAPKMYAALGGTYGPSQNVVSDPPDFRLAAHEAHWTNESAANAVIIPQLFNNAADVADHGLDATALVWPNSVVQTPDGTVTTTEPTQFGGDPIDWTGFRTAEPRFGLTPIHNHTQADVNNLVANYDRFIPLLRKRFEAIRSTWETDDAANVAPSIYYDPTAPTAFEFNDDMSAMEKRWADVKSSTEGYVNRLYEAATHPGDAAVSMWEGVAGLALGASAKESVGDEDVYQKFIHAIKQNGDDGARKSGDFDDLKTRLDAEEVKQNVALGQVRTSQTNPAAYDPGFVAQQPTHKDPSKLLSDKLDALARHVPDPMQYVKLVAAAVIAGVIVNTIVNAAVLRSIIGRPQE
jgi:hypothetical protein